MGFKNINIVTGVTEEALTDAVLQCQTYRDEAEADKVQTNADVVTTTTNANTSTTAATNAQLAQWEAEARKMTADSYATEPEDVFVKVYTSDGDGTFTATPTSEYSALHHASKASYIEYNEVNFDAIHQIGSPTDINTLNKIYNHQYSAGVMFGGDITDNLDGSVGIAESQAMLRATGGSSHSQLYACVIPANATVALTDNATNYVYADHNSGTPILAVTTNPLNVDMLSKVPLYVIVREGTSLTYVDVREQNVDHIGKNQIREFYTAKFTRGTGGIISDNGTRHVGVSAGSFFFQLINYNTPALDTTGADTIAEYKHVAGVWVETAISQLNNTSYDNGTDLVAISNSKYGAHWVYVIAGANPSYAVLYGTEEYATVADAENAVPPSALPPSIEGLGVLIGQFVFQESGAEFISSASAFSTEFESSLAQNHENLSGILGGTINDHQHLTTAQVGLVDNSIQRTATTGSAQLPVGTTAQRDVTPAEGMIRANSELNSFEGYVNGNWGSVGGGATGGGSDKVFHENDQVITTSYTLTAGKNAVTAGTITINDGVTVTIPDGATWTIV